MDKVFWAEIDLERFTVLQGTRARSAACASGGAPTPACRIAVEQPFAHRPHGPCVNPGFLEGAPAMATPD